MLLLRVTLLISFVLLLLSISLSKALPAAGGKSLANEEQPQGQNEESLHEKSEQEELLQKELSDLKISSSNELPRRMARFFMDSISASSASSGNFLDLGLDSNAVLTGILQPENIAIHVAQNAVNFISSSLAWLALGAFASQTSLSGRGIDPEILSAAAAASTNTKTSHSTGKLQPILISSSPSSNSFSVPFMGREIKPPSAQVVKELPLPYAKKKKSTFGDLSPEQKKEFIMKHLTNRNFIASVPFNEEKKKEGILMDKDMMLMNRRISSDEDANENEEVVKKKLVRKIVKKVISVE